MARMKKIGTFSKKLCLCQTLPEDRKESLSCDIQSTNEIKILAEICITKAVLCQLSKNDLR